VLEEVPKTAGEKRPGAKRLENRGARFSKNGRVAAEKARLAMCSRMRHGGKTLRSVTGDRRRAVEVNDEGKNLRLTVNFARP